VDSNRETIPEALCVRIFKLTENEPRPGYRDIRVEGERDLAVADQLQAALDRAASDSVGVLIGLDGCEFIDSTGIAVILRAHQTAGEGRQVVVYAPSAQVLRVLSVTGLTANGLVFESADAALSAAAAAD
jgi:anti-sigma B factor antagonist